VPVKKLHIAQDDFGFWELSLESDDGSLRLLAYQFVEPDHLIQDAYEMIEKGELPDAVLVVDPPRRRVQRTTDAWAQEYRRPAPRKAGV
jgi:hypothetical protein